MQGKVRYVQPLKKAVVLCYLLSAVAFLAWRCNAAKGGMFRWLLAEQSFCFNVLQSVAVFILHFHQQPLCFASVPRLFGRPGC